jgi:4-amino-4-deoxy-L-arabinose transferase-like glycosyltransferase
LIARYPRLRRAAANESSLAAQAAARWSWLAREYWLVAIAFLTAIVLRLAVFTYIAGDARKFFTYDSGGYDRRAMNLLEHGVFAGQARPPFTPDLERTPVYPALMAAVYAVAGHHPAAVVLLQVLLGGLAAVLTFLAARELGLAERAGLIAALLVAVDPVSVMTANRLLTETLFTTLLVAGVWLLLRFWRTRWLPWAAAAAIVFGLAALTRPIAQFLPLVLLPFFGFALRDRRRTLLVSAALFLAISGALMAGWAWRNEREGGVFTLSTIGDTNLIYYRARAVLAAAEGQSQEATWDALEARIEREAARQNLSPSETIAFQRREALEIFREHPLLTAEMQITGAARIFVDPGYTITCTLLDRSSTAFECFPGKSTMNEPGLIDRALGKVGQMTAVQQVTLLAAIVILGVLYAGAALGSLQLARRRCWLALALLLVLIGYFALLSAGAEANSRFRVPIVPFLALLAGAGIDWSLTVARARAEGVWRLGPVAGSRGA